jgi:hypothetical protein
LVEVGDLVVRDVAAVVLPNEALSDNLLGFSFLSLPIDSAGTRLRSADTAANPGHVPRPALSSGVEATDQQDRRAGGPPDEASRSLRAALVL